MGVTLALDDFGTGYSSMAALRKLPIDVMKIDRSFVTDLETDASALPSVRAIVALAQAAQLHLVAEGVETEAQARMLRELGCQELQGYLYSRPVTPPQFLQVPGLRHQPPAA
jgi:EAL domain-containing protein (putative c-di-GMP-specific phosphodiesterase class I)